MSRVIFVTGPTKSGKTKIVNQIVDRINKLKPHLKCSNYTFVPLVLSRFEKHNSYESYCYQIEINNIILSLLNQIFNDILTLCDNNDIIVVDRHPTIDPLSYSLISIIDTTTECCNNPSFLVTLVNQIRNLIDSDEVAQFHNSSKVTRCDILVTRHPVLSGYTSDQVTKEWPDAVKKAYQMQFKSPLDGLGNSLWDFIAFDYIARYNNVNYINVNEYTDFVSNFVRLF